MISGSAASARARPTRCCMPPEARWGSARSSRRARPCASDASAVAQRSALATPCTSRPKAAFSSTVRCGSSADVLEDHADVPWPASRAAPAASSRDDVLPFDEDLAAGRLDQPVEHADQRRLAAARQPMMQKISPRSDLERRVGRRRRRSRTPSAPRSCRGRARQWLSSRPAPACRRPSRPSGSRAGRPSASGAGCHIRLPPSAAVSRAARASAPAARRRCFSSS